MRCRAFDPSIRLLTLAVLATAVACSDSPGPTEVAPTIGLSPTSVEFSVTAGGAPPPARVVSVTSNGSGSLNGLSASVSYAAGPSSGWLNATLNTTSTPASLSVQPTPGSLAPGTYSATVTLSSSVAGVASRTIAVSLTVSAPAPEMALSSASVNFSAQAGGVDPPAQSVSVTNAGGGALSGLAASISKQAGQPSGWLTATLGGPTAPTSIQIRPVIGSLAAGVYSATITITAQGAGARTIAVELTVAGAAPSIVVSPGAVGFSHVIGSAPPAVQTVSVTNSGGGTLSGLGVSVGYQAGQPSGWLSATLSSTTAPANLSLQASLGSLAAGTYSAMVSIAAPGASNSPRIVTVTFIVSAAAPSIVLSSSAISFNAQVGGAQPAAQSVSITNGGGGTLSGLARTISYASGQPTGWLSGSLSSTTAPATLTIQPSLGTLSAGTYSATVVITAPGATTRSVAVSLVLSAAPATYTLTASPVPVDGGTIARSPNQPSYASGTIVTLTAAPRTGWRFTTWSGSVVSSANPASITMDANKSVTANFALDPPVVTTASASGTTVTLSWTYKWPCGSSGCLVSSGDYYVVEQSTTSSTSGFTVAHSTPMGVRTDPYVLTMTRAAGTYYFRVRAMTMFGPSDYSLVRTVVVSAPSEITVLPSHDNALLYSTTDDGARNRVYQTGDIGVGCNWAVGFFVTDWLCASSALRFDGLQSQIAGRTIVKATLRLYPYMLPGDWNTNYAVNAFAASWSPSQITFANQPNYFTSGQATRSPPATTVLPMEFDVTIIVRNWANGSWANNGLLLRDTNITIPASTAFRLTGIESLEYHSSASRRPQLHVQFQ